MNDCTIHAAAWLGPEGYGNDQTGLQAWPASLQEDLSRGNLDCLHWSLLSPSDPSRFLRMDLMCRLGFLAVELLAVDFAALPGGRREALGVCVESSTGSLDADIRFIQNPRPSIFAYTLPSTVIGEICIRHGFKGPVLSLISPDTEGADALAEGSEWIRGGEAEMAVCLDIEALNPLRTAAIHGPTFLSPSGWHGMALLLGPPALTPREKPLVAGSLKEICRKWCAVPEHTC